MRVRTKIRFQRFQGTLLTMRGVFSRGVMKYLGTAGTSQVSGRCPPVGAPWVPDPTVLRSKIVNPVEPDLGTDPHRQLLTAGDGVRYVSPRASPTDRWKSVFQREVCQL